MRSRKNRLCSDESPPTQVEPSTDTRVALNDAPELFALQGHDNLIVVVCDERAPVWLRDKFTNFIISAWLRTHGVQVCDGETPLCAVRRLGLVDSLSADADTPSIITTAVRDQVLWAVASFRERHAWGALVLNIGTLMIRYSPFSWPEKVDWGGSKVGSDSPPTGQEPNVGDLQIRFDLLINPEIGLIGRELSIGLTDRITLNCGGSFRILGRGGSRSVRWGSQEGSVETGKRLAVLEGLERLTAGHNQADLPTARYSSRTVPNPINLAPAGISFRTTARHYGEVSPSCELDWAPVKQFGVPGLFAIPGQLVHYLQPHDEPLIVQETSSGCALGSTLESALLRSFLELVERDAFLIGWYRQAELRCVEIGTFPSVELKQLSRAASHFGYTLRLFDNRIDINVPIFTAVAEGCLADTACSVFGTGASLDPVAAALSAARECMSRVDGLSREVSLSDRRFQVDDLEWVSTVRDHALLAAMQGFKSCAPHYFSSDNVVDFADLELPVSPHNTRRSLDNIVAQIADAGSHCFYVDQTSPELIEVDLKCTRAIAPGLIPIDFGAARQRAPRLERMHNVKPRYLPNQAWDRPLTPVPHPFA